MHHRSNDSGDLCCSFDRIHISSALNILELPEDLFVIFLDYLDLESLHHLSLTCKRLYELVDKLGWSSYLRRNPRPSWTLSCTDRIWSPRQRVRYDTLTESNWAARKFVARPLLAAWRTKLLPVIAIARTRLVVATGAKLQVFVFCASASAKDGTSCVRFEAAYTVKREEVNSAPEARHDVTAIAFLPDGGRDRTLLVGFADGQVMRITLPEYSTSASSSQTSDATTDIVLPASNLSLLYEDIDSIEGLSVSGPLSLTVSNSNLARATLRHTSSGTLSPLQLDARGWSAHLSPTTSSSPYAAFGTSSRRTPLAIHAITESSLSPTPSHVLSSIGRHKDADDADGYGAEERAREASAVYGIASAPPSFSGGAAGQTLVAGWFDGYVRVYDLRVPSSSSVPVPTSTPTHTPSGGTSPPSTPTRTTPTAIGTSVFTSTSPSVPVHKPVLSMCDPWSTEPIYTVATGGGTGYTIAAGSARHSVVAFWDVRSPRDGWSVHAPGNDSSPVYSIAFESSRLFGATQSRSFVLDFGPGVCESTYPPVPPSAGRLDRNLRTANGVHYTVMRYIHRNPTADV